MTKSIRLLRLLRTIHNIPQEALAFELGVDTTAIGKIERGALDPGDDLKKRMAARFDLPSRILLTPVPEHVIAEAADLLKERVRALAH